MKRLFGTALFSLLLCLSLCFGVCAQKSAPIVVDNADVLSEAEEEKLFSKLVNINEEYNVTAVVVTVDSVGRKTPEAYADDFYDYDGYGKDGILLLVSMEESDYHISTSGDAIEIFTDDGLEYMADKFVPYMSDGDFYDAFIAFSELCEEFLAQAESGEPYDYHNLPKEPFAPGAALLISLIVGFISAFIATAIMRAKLKSVHSRPAASDYVKKDSFELTRSNDIFLYRNLKVIPIPKSESKGGSSVHTSSSGRSHGGFGGKF